MHAVVVRNISPPQCLPRGEENGCAANGCADVIGVGGALCVPKMGAFWVERREM
jgi:hypothetical protein